MEKWNQWHCGILIESSQAFFDTADDDLVENLQKELRRVFFYLNLNGRQSLLLFNDVYCDYVLVANHLYSMPCGKPENKFHAKYARLCPSWHDDGSIPDCWRQSA